MDRSPFSDKTQGQLVEINIHGSKDWAFVPNSLPEQWKVPEGIWPLLAEAREELARLDGVGRHMPDYELLLRPLQQREALKSSSLEGTYATPEQLLLFEIDPKEPKSRQDRVNSWREVYNYGRALRTGQELLETIPLSLRLFKELHTVLLTGVRGQKSDPGNFRRTQVHIGSDRRFIPPPPQEAIKCLNDLEVYINRDHSIDPLIFCFMVHYQFETIHPFLDGNGRVGRLLLSLMIYKLCKLTSPWLYLSAFFDRYKDEYIDSLFNVSSKGDWNKWIEYCLRATIYQAKDSIARFDRLVELRAKYLKAISGCGGSIRLHTIIERLLAYPVITIPGTARMFHMSYPTARNDIELLVECKILTTSQTSSRPKVYMAGEIMDAAYSDQIE
jgi:Fic family protein